MGPKSIENNVLKIFGRDLSEIGAPGTSGVSLGTKFLVSKIFSYHPQIMLFYAFWGFVTQKVPKKEKKALFMHFSSFFTHCLVGVRVNFSILLIHGIQNLVISF